LPIRQEWLDWRCEEILEPDLPIVDPHHRLVDRPETGRYLLPELLADLGSGHNITATVYLEWLSMHRAAGPAEMRPVGEIEFANGIAAVAASGTYGKTRVCAGIVGYAGSDARGAGREGARRSRAGDRSNTERFRAGRF
jgi:L-fuconolactonase